MRKRYEKAVCNDGYTVSIQADKFVYCTPRIDCARAYSEVELGFPSEHDSLLDGYDCPITGQSFGYVPVGVVRQLIAKHGGLKSKTPLPPGVIVGGESGQTRHHYTKRPSANVKTGPVTVTRTTTDTCPKSCPLLGNGCYDQQGNGNIHRTKVDAGKYQTVSINEYMREIRNFTQLYRHNEGGDLWNGKTSEHICAETLRDFATSNRLYRRTPIVYTHKACVGTRAHWAIRKKNREAIQNSGASFAINTSVESLTDVDEALDYGLDCVVVLPADTGKGVTKTPGGNRVVTCPATYGRTQCVSCGKGEPLCTRKGRGYAIGFPAHGASKRKVTLNILKG